MDGSSHFFHFHKERPFEGLTLLKLLLHVSGYTDDDGEEGYEYCEMGD